MNDLVQIISTVGFPIACCIAMGYFFKYITDKDRDERVRLSDLHKEEMQELNAQHKEEMKEITEAINNNTLAIQKLCERMEN